MKWLIANVSVVLNAIDSYFITIGKFFTWADTLNVNECTCGPVRHKAKPKKQGKRYKCFGVAYISWFLQFVCDM